MSGKAGGHDIMTRRTARRLWAREQQKSLLPDMPDMKGKAR